MASNVLDEFLILFRTRLTGDGIQKVNKQLGHTRNQLFATKNLFKTFFAYDLYGAFSRLIPNLVETTQRLGAMESRFSAVTGQAQTGTQELAWIGEESKRLGLNFLETADNYSIFYATMRNTQGQGATRQIFQQWSEAFRVLHIDPERQGRILYALREMSSKGKIYMSDLAVQLGSAVPDAMGLAAKSMGYFGKEGMQKFREDIKAGKVDVNEFLRAFSGAVNQTYVSAEKLAIAMNKPDAQLQKLATNWQMFQIAFAKGGFEKDLVNFLKTANLLLSAFYKMAPVIWNIAKAIVIAFGAGSLGLLTQWLVKLKNISKEIGFLNALRYLSLDSMAPIMSFLAPFLTNPYVLGAILIVGVGYLLAWILHKFFPNVEKALFNVWDIFVLSVENLMLTVENWLHSLPMLSDYFQGINTGDLNNKASSDITSKWTERFPDYKSLSNFLPMVEGMKYLNPFKQDFKQDIKIETTVHVNGTNASPQEIANEVSKKQKEDVGKAVKNIPKK